MTQADPAIVEAGMRLRAADRQSWDDLVTALGLYSDAVAMRMRNAAPEEIISMQGMAIALHTVYRMLFKIEEHHRNLSEKKR